MRTTWSCSIRYGVLLCRYRCILLLAFAKKGIKVPEELKIIGFDGLEITRMSDPI